ncbi:MAG: HIT domain-containing protein [Patescibacteria group bacterium]
MFIFETKNFIVESHEQPFMPRTDGGHVRIVTKDKSITERRELKPKTAIELMRLTMIVGEALENIMNKQGIPVIKINYQDMGNWAWKTNTKPFLHVHIFGRATNAVKQPWPESMYLPDRKTGFYEGFEPLNEKDIELLKAEIETIFKRDKYQDKEWDL